MELEIRDAGFPRVMLLLEQKLQERLTGQELQVLPRWMRQAGQALLRPVWQ